MKSVRKNKKVAVKPVKRFKPVRRRTENNFTAYLQSQYHVLIASLMRLLQTPFTSAMAISVMAIAIALAGSFYILVSNGQQLVDSLQTGKQISVFLHEQITDQQAREFAQKLQSNEQIADVSVISKQQALAEFQKYSGFGAALSALEANPLPVVIQVFPAESLTGTQQLSQLLTKIKAEQEVDLAQLDMDWVMRLQSMMQIVNRVLLLLSVLLALAVVFVTGNTIRLELQTRRDEVIVHKLVGASNRFICLPFLYSGFWLGLISGMFAWGIIAFMLLMIHSPVEQLALLYQSHFQLHFMSFSESVSLLLGSSVLGISGALVVAYYQLRQLKPE